MSTKARTFYTVTCDGEHATPVQFLDATFSSAIEARAAAYNAGWRFPAKLLNDGSPSPTQVSDVCPHCTETFEPQLVMNPHQGRRSAS